jgi:hypothetical protein
MGLVIRIRRAVLGWCRRRRRCGLWRSRGFEQWVWDWRRGGGTGGVRRSGFTGEMGRDVLG